MAERSGWKIVKVYQDAGISGAKGRIKRPGLDAMMKAVNAKEFDMVASWSVDRRVDRSPTCSPSSRDFMIRVSGASARARYNDVGGQSDVSNAWACSPSSRGVSYSEVQNYSLYVAGINASTKQVDAAKALIAYLESPAVKQALTANGFEPR